jgi:hypothetical protein
VNALGKLEVQRYSRERPTFSKSCRSYIHLLRSIHVYGTTAPLTAIMAAQALETYEMLEDILLHLPLRQLLFSQRVNNRFEFIIQDSLRIKQALFLEPTTKKCVQPHQWYCDSSKQLRERLIIFQPMWSDDAEWSEGGKLELYAAVANPFLQ